MTAGSLVRPGDHVFLRLSNGSLKAVECRPNQIVEITRVGTISSNAILGRPYYHTFEVLEKQEGEQHPRLRVVTPHELDAERVAGEASLTETRDASAEDAANGQGETIDLVTEDGKVIVKDNRLIIDDGSRQILTQTEIEALKKSAGGKEIIEKILANHTALDEKTAFSKAKYTLRKSRKYLKRFTLLPMELGLLIEYILEKEPSRIMELREESLALVSTWTNAHWQPEDDTYTTPAGQVRGEGRLLVVDDVGGLLVAALAERKGILRKPEQQDADVAMEDADSADDHQDFPTPAKTNSITLIHSAVQPNVSLLKYFGYNTNNPDTQHPLHTHFKPLSWLQLLHPEEDPLYQEPETVSTEILDSYKAGKRGTYFKKQRRWQRCKSIVDEAREGEFDALVVATHMDPVSVFQHAIPLLRGGAHVVVYSPTIESLTRLMDFYSKERRQAYIAELQQRPSQQPSLEDFPVDPRLLLATTLQTSRIREYQVLPGRTHPLMTSKGGPEGYVFTARRVLPLQSGVEARGNFTKKRKIDAVEPAVQ